MNKSGLGGWAFSMFLGVLFYFLAVPMSAAQIPFQQTFSAEIPVMTRLSVGIERMQGRNMGDLEQEGTLWTLPRVQVNVPLGSRGEFIASQDVVRSLTEREKAYTSGGDPYFFTKLRLFDQQRYIPATAFMYGVLEPAANPPLGADTLGFYAYLVLTQQQEPWRVDLNFGTGIFEDHARSRQTDVVIMNAALWYRPNGRWQLGGEYHYQERVEGRWFDFTQGVNSPLRRRNLAAMALYGDKWKGFFRVSRGLVAQSEDWSVATGVQFQWPEK
ncbi:hypothetical protein ACFOSD_10035 [Salinispirillum marinum]|uniref:Transporter n=2 Tax=Saccharospirillaceae TaxID=255527 RepID=A0ABV8BHB2_9GAMM